jgi:hypothetical protein
MSSIRYQEPDGSFELELPEGWEAERDGEGGLLLNRPEGPGLLHLMPFRREPEEDGVDVRPQADELLAAAAGDLERPPLGRRPHRLHHVPEVEAAGRDQRQPAVAAGALAARLGVEKLKFKRDVRKLKELGLTESLEMGYRLSPRGETMLPHLQQSNH